MEGEKNPSEYKSQMMSVRLIQRESKEKYAANHRPTRSSYRNQRILFYRYLIGSFFFKVRGRQVQAICGCSADSACNCLREQGGMFKSQMDFQTVREGSAAVQPIACAAQAAIESDLSDC